MSLCALSEGRRHYVVAEQVDFSALRQALRIVKNGICTCQFSVIMSKKIGKEEKEQIWNQGGFLQYLFLHDSSLFLVKTKLLFLWIVQSTRIITVKCIPAKRYQCIQNWKSKIESPNVLLFGGFNFYLGFTKLCYKKSSPKKAPFFQFLRGTRNRKRNMLSRCCSLSGRELHHVKHCPYRFMCN